MERIVRSTVSAAPRIGTNTVITPYVPEARRARNRLPPEIPESDEPELRPGLGPDSSVAQRRGDLRTHRLRPPHDGPQGRMDGKLRSAAQSTPAEWTLDTTLLANGSHELIVRAVDETGNVSTTSLPFTSNNANAAPLPIRPEIPRKYTHIRIAQLAYSGNPLGDFEKARLKDSVDLVVPNPQYLSAIDAASPTTPQIIYSNLSNLYQGLLTDWLNYADRTNAAREAAFYHVSQATAFTGSSPSSQPVNYFWDVSRSNISGTGTPTDYTSAKRAEPGWSALVLACAVAAPVGPGTALPADSAPVS